jgi:RsiW-degrading membrane proteinase PrsW (M82 family)
MIASDFVPVAMVAAAIAPALLSLWLVVAADSRPEPARVVLIALLLGVLSAMVAVVVELWLQRHLPVARGTLLAVVEKAVLLAAIPEEVLKVSLIAALVLRSRDFDEPMDGVVYGTAVGLGFAMLENLFYVAAGPNWQGVAVLRGVLSVPLHGAFGAIAGAYIARARFSGILGSGRGARWRRPRLFASALLVPTALHGVFDTAVFAIKGASETAPHGDDGAVAILLALLVAAVVGFGTIGFAAVLARRIARRQKAWIATKRLPAGHWRHVWAECLAGLGLSCVGVAMVIAGASAGIVLAGALLVAAAAGLVWICARKLNAMAMSRHRDAAAASAA